MKTPVSTIIAITFFLLASHLPANPATRILVEQALKASGRKGAEAATLELAEQAAASAVKMLGRTEAEKLIRVGGLQLLEAGARHGDEVLKLASRVPEAARYIGASPGEALSLAARLGENGLRIEARMPGLASQAAEHFGKKELGLLARSSPEEVTRLVGLAGRADSAETRGLLYETWKRRGKRLLDELETRKMLILAGGLTASMLTVADGLQDAIQDMPEKTPKALEGFTQEVGAGISSSLIVIAFGVASALAGWTWLRRPERK
jgi:hypothetical protein